MDVFMCHANKDYQFLQDIKKEYEEKIVTLYSDSSENIQESRAIDIRNKVKELFLSKLSEE